MADSVLLNGKTVSEKERNYGIDLLRILSMFMVVVLHVNKYANLLGNYNADSYVFVWFSEAFAICAVNVYAIISGYVLFNSKFKLKRLLQLYIEVLFFRLISYVLMATVYDNFYGFTDLIKGLIFVLPLQGTYFWYFKAYFLLYLIFPILNIAVKNMTKGQFILLFTVLAVFVCIVTQYGYGWGFEEGYSFIWLVAMYFIGAYFKKFGLLKISALKGFLIYCGLSILILAWKTLNDLVLPPIKINTVKEAFDFKYDPIAYTSIFVVLQAVFLFNSFAKIQIKSGFWQKAVLFVSPLTFGVYSVHCTDFVKVLLGKFDFIINSSVLLIIPLTIGCALAVFIGCAVIEWIKQQIFKYAKIDKLTFKVGDFIQNKITAFADKKAEE